MLHLEILYFLIAIAFGVHSSPAEKENSIIIERQENQNHICDSLFQTKQFFELRDSVQQWHGLLSRNQRYFRGLVESIFNEPSKSVADLRSYLILTSST